MHKGWTFQATCTRRIGTDSGGRATRKRMLSRRILTYSFIKNYLVSDIEVVGRRIELIPDNLHQDRGMDLIQTIIESLNPPPGEPGEALRVLPQGGVRLPSKIKIKWKFYHLLS